MLGTVGFGSVALDAPRHRLFVSLPVANVVRVFDYSGAVIADIANQYGATGLVIRDSTLYVAQRTAGKIEKIDLTTLADIGPLASGLTMTGRLAFAGGRFWVAIGDDQWTTLASVDAAGTVQNYSTMYYQPDFATAAATPNTLFMSENGVSPTTIYRLDVSQGAPAVAASYRTDGGNTQDLAVTSDGTSVIPASGAPYEFVQYSAATMSPDGVVYPAMPYPTAVSVSHSPCAGELIATGLKSTYNDPGISVFVANRPSAVFTASTLGPNGRGRVLPHGLIVTPSNDRLFAFTGEGQYWTPSVVLHIYDLNNPAIACAETQPTLMAPASVAFGAEDAQPINVQVSGSSGVTPTGKVTIVSAQAEHNPVCVVDLSDGIGSCRLAPSQLPAGTYDLVAHYPLGTNTQPSDSAPVRMVVERAPTETAIAAPTPVEYGTSIGVGVSVSSATTAVPNGTVDVVEGTDVLCVATLAGGTGNCTVPAGRLNAGPHLLVGKYAGNLNIAPSSSTAQITTIVPAASTITMTSPATLAYGSEDKTPFTITVGTSGLVPTGSIAVFSESTQLCTAKLSGGTARCVPAAAALPPGTYKLKARYVPDSPNFSGSATGKPVAIDVIRGGTALVASGILTSSAAGQAVITFKGTLTQRADGRPIAGQVIGFAAKDRSGADVAACSATTDASGTAQCSASISAATAVATSGYTAQFDGNFGYEPSTAKGWLASV